MKKFLVLLAVIITTLSCSVFAVNFSDLTSDHWAYKPISDMTEKGILSGYPDGSFKPNQSITRAEFAKILVNTLNLTNDSTNNIQFNDVLSDHWAYNYINVASRYLTGYQNGSEYIYMPDSAAVREDMALAIVKAMGLDNKEYKADTLNKFSDKDTISENLKKYVAIAAEYGLMNGNADGTFNPKGSLTRAEVCQLMTNALNNLEKIVIDTKPEQTKKEVLLSANKKDGSRLHDTDSIKLSAQNCDFEKGSLDYRVLCDETLILPGSFKDGDKLKVKTIIDEAKKKKIDLYGKEITLTLFFDNIEEKKSEGKISYEYKIVAKSFDENDEDVELKLSANKKDGASLKDTDTIVLSASKYNTEAGSLDFRVSCNDTLILPGSFKDGDTLKVKTIIDEAEKKNVDVYGKEITLTLFFDNIQEKKAEGKVTYKYTILKNETSTIVPLKQALVDNKLDGKTLESGFDKGEFYEFFVNYNRPLKEAKVEAKDQNGKAVSLVDARVATEHEVDAVKNDISSVRIRIKFEFAKRYTFTVKNVVDKEGNKIEDYSFDVSTIVPIKDALVKAQMEGEIASPTIGLFTESFVIYNRPLKEAKVEVRDAFDELVSGVEGKVATEYEEDAVKNDISSVRIRMKLNSNDSYRITVKDVVDKDGFKIEDYTFTVKVSE